MRRLITKRYFSSSSAKSYSILFFGSEQYACSTLTGILNFHNFSSLIKRLVVVVPPFTNTVSPTRSMHELIKGKQLEKIVYRKKLKSIEEYIAAQKTKNVCPFDIGIISSFGRIIPPQMMKMFPSGILVAHPSLLPKYRGPCPIQHAALNGDSKTGVSIIDISKEVDGGKILWQGSFKIEDADNYHTLAVKCGKLASEGLNIVLGNLEEYRKKGSEQSTTNSSKAPMIKDSMFHWDKLTQLQAVRFQRALYGSPSNPHSKILLKGKKKFISFEILKEVDKNSKLYKGILAPIEEKLESGSLHWGTNPEDKDKLFIRCNDGWVYSTSVKIEGAKFVKASNFIKNQLKGETFTHKLLEE